MNRKFVSVLCMAFVYVLCQGSHEISCLFVRVRVSIASVVYVGYDGL